MRSAWKIVIAIGILALVSGILKLPGLPYSWREISFHLLVNAVFLAFLLNVVNLKKKTGVRSNKIISLLMVGLYLVFLASFWIHLKPIADILADSSSPFILSILKAGFNYSSQLKCTFFMLLSNISACSIFLYLIYRNFQLLTSDKSIEPGDEANPSANFLPALIVGFTVLFMYAAIQRHDLFLSKAWDMAIFAQMLDNFHHGIFFEVNVRGLENIFSDHFTPIIYFFSPFLYIWNDPVRLLLTIQAIFLAMGAIPVYLIAKKRLQSKESAGLIGIVYLLMPVLQYMNLFDFHPVVLSIPLMLFAWYFMEIRKFGLMYLFLALTMLCHEEMWIVVGAFGLFIAIFNGYRLHGLILTAIGWGGFIALVLFFFPAFRESGDYFYIHRYAYLGNTLGEIAVNFITKPQLWIPRFFTPRVFVFIFLILLPVGFLPLFRPKYLLILLPTFFYSVLSIEPLQVSIFAQYAAPYVPFVIISAIYGIESILTRSGNFNINRIKAIAWMALCIGFIANIYFGTIGFSKAGKGLVSEQEYFQHEIYSKAITEFEETYKDGYDISAGSKFAPHLVRQELHLFPDSQEGTFLIFDPDDYHGKTELWYINQILNSWSYSGVYQEKRNYMDLHIQHSNPPVSLLKILSLPSVKSPTEDELDSFRQCYFIIMIFPSKFNEFLYGGVPDFEIYRKFDEYRNPDWRPDEIPRAFKEFHIDDDFDTDSEIYVLPLPYDYPNTLDEYFTEFYISTLNFKMAPEIVDLNREPEIPEPETTDDDLMPLCSR